MGNDPRKPGFEDLVIPLPRMSLNPPVPIEQLHKNDDQTNFFGYAVNITREGIFVPTVNPKPIGFRTKVRLLLPRLKTVIEGEIEVVWSREYDPRKSKKASGMGIKFIDLPEESKRQIDAFCGK